MSDGSVAITVRGRHFQSQAACARHFGISKQAVFMARKRGRLDYIGLGSETGLKAGHGLPNQKKPFKFPVPNSPCFDSRKAAYESLGVGSGVFYRAQNAGRLKELYKTGKLTPKPIYKIPVRIGKVRYESIAAASRATGFTYATIRNAHLTGTLKDLAKKT